MIALAAGNLGAAQTARNGSFNALGSALHGALNGLLHSAAEAYALLQLSRDILGNQLRVHIRLFNLHNVYVYRTADKGGNILAERLYSGAAFAYKRARLGRIEINGGGIGLALNLYFGDAHAVQLFLEIFAEPVVLRYIVCKFLFISKPTGVPALYNANPGAVRINFLTHLYASFTLSRPESRLYGWFS